MLLLLPGCGQVWMNCQGQCGRPPMFNEVQQQGYTPVETLMVAGNAFVSGVLGVFVGVVTFYGLFMILTPDITAATHTTQSHFC